MQYVSRVSTLVRTLALVVIAACLFEAAHQFATGALDLQPARELKATGHSARVVESVVYLETGRGTLVGDVRVRIPERPQLMYLSDITQTDSDLDDMLLGWQPATEATGYVPPFEIRYLIGENGIPVAMAVTDLAGRGSYQPLVTGAGCTLVAGLLSGVDSARSAISYIDEPTIRGSS